jgi:hypothetical protein
MKTVAGLLVALVLIAAGGVLLAQARITDRAAEAHRRLAVLQYPDQDALDSTTATWDLPRWDLGILSDDIARYRSTVTYWLARHDALTPLLELTGPQAIKDPAILYAAANAVFRKSEPTKGDRKDAVERLDGVMQAYADVVRMDPSHADASYNYEYVARIRDLVAKGRVPPRPAANPTDSIEADLPPGPTVHGWPGMPPPEVDLGDFKTLTPMKFEEREEMAEPGKGAFQKRKG